MNRKLKKLLRSCLTVLLGFVVLGIASKIFPISKYRLGLARKTVPSENDFQEIIDPDYSLKKGNGEHGKPFIVPSDKAKEKAELYKVNGFNALASDYIALTRSLPDIRHPGCLKEVYSSNLPSVSIIIPFHNEHLSVLLRTVISTLNRSPKGIVKEVILVDDGSTKELLKAELDQYISSHLAVAKVLRLDKRSGLIRARIAGAKLATADVLIFLDSHTEANVGWLPPLLDPIVENRKTVVCPFIDVIDHETFEYRTQDEGARGSWDWEFNYKRLPLRPEDLKNPTKPFKSPVMAGGLFAIEREYFWELGGYDEGLEIWGGEQYELSFKIWQCGGLMVDAPCSRIGHIYRKFPPFPGIGLGNYVDKNHKRVAEVWMDEYAEYAYKRKPAYKDIDPGDLTKQRQIRTKLNCKSFKWFMENIAFDQPRHYPAIEPPHYAEGEIRSVVDPTLCVDSKFKKSNERFGLEKCSKDEAGLDGEQRFSLTWHKDIRPGKRTVCWDVSNVDDNAPVLLWSCHGQQGNQLWRYLPDKKWLQNGQNNRCLDCNPDRKEIFITKCNSLRETQKWMIETVDFDRLKKWDDENPGDL